MAISLRLLDLFPVAGSRKKRLYRQSKVDFYQSRNVLSTIAAFDPLLNLNHLDSYSTEKEIRFYGLPFGTSYKEAIRKLGRPNYVEKSNLPNKYQRAIFYRIRIKEVNCILQMHFFTDQFFFGQIEIRDISEKRKREIAQLLCKKYSVDDENWTGEIVDKSGNTISIRHNMIPSVSYLTGDQQLMRNIKVEVQAERKKKYKTAQEPQWLLDMV